MGLIRGQLKRGSLKELLRYLNIDIVVFFLGPARVRRSSLPGSGLSSQQRSSKSATAKTPQILIGLETAAAGQKRRYN